MREKRNNRLLFWLFFIFYFVPYLVVYGNLAYEFGYIYIWGIGLTVSFFLAWISSIFVIILKSNNGQKE